MTVNLHFTLTVIRVTLVSVFPDQRRDTLNLNGTTQQTVDLDKIKEKTDKQQYASLSAFLTVVTQETRDPADTDTPCFSIHERIYIFRHVSQNKLLLCLLCTMYFVIDIEKGIAANHLLYHMSITLDFKTSYNR